jgi:hypothetical protein
MGRVGPHCHTLPTAHYSLKASLVKGANYGVPHYVNPSVVPEISLDVLGQVNICKYVLGNNNFD